MSAWFADCGTVADIKTLYRKLAMLHHPDRGGVTAVMQEINAAYHAALSGKHESVYMGEDRKPHTYYYNATVEQALMDKIAELIHMHMPDVNIWLVGSWIWLLGETRPYKDALKAMGFWWNGTRKAWSFHLGHWSGGRSPDSLSGLARQYGLREFTNESADTGVAA